jgi:hypothetical protein
VPHEGSWKACWTSTRTRAALAGENMGGLYARDLS